jgi:putative flippase GtrA
MSGAEITFAGRIVRYAVAGSAVTLGYSAAVMALVAIWPELGATAASALAFLPMLLFGYGLHGRVTFPDRAARKDRFLRFAITNVVAFAISVGGMAVVTTHLGLSYLYGIGLNWILIPATNFSVYCLWVFGISRRRMESGR